MTSTLTSDFVGPPAHGPTRPTLTGSFGMVASTHWLASATGQSVLERGGNAFDAAAAASFVLFVVEPHLNGPGGDLVALFAPRSSGPRVLMGQGAAPLGATISHYRSEGLAEVPGTGALSAAIPGSVEAWIRLLRDYGTWEFPDIVSYAIHYAEHGHQISGAAASVIATMADHFRTHWPSSAKLWLDAEGAAPAPGTVIRNIAAGETFRRLADHGTGTVRADRLDAVLSAWKEGFVAEAVLDSIGSSHRHSTGSDHVGVLTAADLRDPVATEESQIGRAHV